MSSWSRTSVRFTPRETAGRNGLERFASCVGVVPQVLTSAAFWPTFSAAGSRCCGRHWFPSSNVASFRTPCVASLPQRAQRSPSRYVRPAFAKSHTRRFGRCTADRAHDRLDLLSQRRGIRLGRALEEEEISQLLVGHLDELDLHLHESGCVFIDGIGIEWVGAACCVCLRFDRGWLFFERRRDVILLGRGREDE